MSCLAYVDNAVLESGDAGFQALSIRNPFQSHDDGAMCTPCAFLLFAEVFTHHHDLSDLYVYPLSAVAVVHPK
jgi:hypothetical protein